MENTANKKPVHVGRNIQRFRLIRGLSQAGLAHQLEEKRKRPVSQQLVSDIEDRESIADEELLKQISEVLDVSAETLKTVDFDSAVSFISNTFTNNMNAGYTINNNPTFNQLDKLIELFEREKAELKAEIERLKKPRTK